MIAPKWQGVLIEGSGKYLGFLVGPDARSSWSAPLECCHSTSSAVSGWEEIIKESSSVYSVGFLMRGEASELKQLYDIGRF